MVGFLALGIGGIVLLILSLAFDGMFEGHFHSPLPVVAGFVSMLGFTGAVVLGTTPWGAAGSLLVGVLAGAATSGLTWQLSRVLMRDHTSVTPRAEHLVGTDATVVTAIPADGYGEVLLRAGGQSAKFAARSSVPLERGAEVWVEAVLSTTSVAVRPTRP